MPAKCIYCNSEELTVSDIIPWALTGAKLRRKFVCKEHNSFTNDYYEKHMIEHLSFFRNQIGLTERDGDPVRYTGDVEIDGIKLKSIKLSDKSSLLGKTNRLFPAEESDGKRSLVGNLDLLSKIKDVKRESLKTLDIRNITVNKRINLAKMIISNEALHTIAKIAYEWHCYVNDVNIYDEVQYGEIVSYILNPDKNNTYVDIVIDGHAYNLMDSYCMPGSNIIYEYVDTDGYVYVVFGLWDVIMYKVKIRDTGRRVILPTTLITAYIYHSDGSNGNTTFGIYGLPQVVSEDPMRALKRIHKEIAQRLALLSQRYLSINYLKSCADVIKKSIHKYKTGKYDIAELFDYENKDRVIAILIFHKLLENKASYNTAKSFNDNLRDLLGVNDTYTLTREDRDMALKKYLEMEKSGTLIPLLEDSIEFFETILIQIKHNMITAE